MNFLEWGLSEKSLEELIDLHDDMQDLFSNELENENGPTKKLLTQVFSSIIVSINAKKKLASYRKLPNAIQAYNEGSFTSEKSKFLAGSGQSGLSLFSSIDNISDIYRTNNSPIYAWDPSRDEYSLIKLSLIYEFIEE